MWESNTEIKNIGIKTFIAWLSRKTGCYIQGFLTNKSRHVWKNRKWVIAYPIVVTLFLTRKKHIHPFLQHGTACHRSELIHGKQIYVLWMRQMHLSHSDWSTKSQLFTTFNINKEKPSARFSNWIFLKFLMFTSEPSFFDVRLLSVVLWLRYRLLQISSLFSDHSSIHYTAQPPWELNFFHDKLLLLYFLRVRNTFTLFYNIE